MSVFTRLSRSPDEAIDGPGVGEADNAGGTDDARPREAVRTTAAAAITGLARIFGWGWQDSLRPSPDAPVWPMDAFRDRFLTPFGSRQVP